MKKTFAVISVMIVLIGAVSVAAYMYIQSRQVNQLPADEAKELAAVVQQVSQLMDVPAAETPVLATVTDKTKVNTQPFFARSENGDKVLLYTQFGRAILYRPSTNKIIDVTVINTTETVTPLDTIETNAAPIATPTSAPQPSPTEVAAPQAPTAPITVLLLNGTLTAGLANATEQRLTPLLDNVEISTRNALQQNYTTTRVIARSAASADVAAELASFFSVAVTSQLPEDETATDADIVVILGEDAR